MCFVWLEYGSDCNLSYAEIDAISGRHETDKTNKTIEQIQQTIRSSDSSSLSVLNGIDNVSDKLKAWKRNKQQAKRIIFQWLSGARKTIWNRPNDNKHI